MQNIDYTKDLKYHYKDNEIYREWEKHPDAFKLQWHIGNISNIGKITNETILENGEKQFLVNGKWYSQDELKPQIRSYGYYKKLAHKTLRNTDELNQAKYFYRMLSSNAMNDREFFDKVINQYQKDMVASKAFFQNNVKNNIFTSQVYNATINTGNKALLDKLFNKYPALKKQNFDKKIPFTDNTIDYAKAKDIHNIETLYKQWEAISNQIKLSYKWQVGDKTSLGKIIEEFNLPNGEKQFLVNGNYYHEKVLTPPLRSFSYYKGLANKKLTPQEINQAKFFLKEVTYKDSVNTDFKELKNKSLEYESVSGRNNGFKLGYLQKNIKDNIFYSQVEEALKNDDKALNAFYDRFKAMRNKEV